jgi:hypothetical protein
VTNIEIEGGDLVVDVLGWDKLLALKGSLRFPLAGIDRYGPAAGEAANIPPFRVGTSLPGLQAGTFFGNGVRSFWDVDNFDQAIVIYFREGDYEKIVVQVADVSDTLGRIARALG